jgi:hypothetical protein
VQQQTNNPSIAGLKSAWRFRWRGMIAAWTICLLGWAGILAIADQATPASTLVPALAAEHPDRREALQNEIRKLESDIAAASYALENFEVENVDRLPSARNDNLVRLETTMVALEGTETDLRSARDQREALQQEFADFRPSFELIAISEEELDRRIAEYERGLEVLQRRYSDDSPEVIEVREALDKMLAQKNWKSDKEKELASLDTGIARLQADRDIYQAEIVETQDLLANTSNVESGLERLAKDLETLQSEYQSALVRLAATDEIAAAEPVQETSPAAIDLAALPDRHTLLMGVLVFGLVAGTAVALVTGGMRPLFTDTSSLRMATELPVLGAVPVFKSTIEGQKRLRETVGFFVAIALLVAVFGVLYTSASLAERVIGP